MRGNLLSAANQQENFNFYKVDQQDIFYHKHKYLSIIIL